MCTFNYPGDYAQFTKEQQDGILSWFNTTKEIERGLISYSTKSKNENELKAFR